MPRTVQAGSTHPPLLLRATDPDTGGLFPVAEALSLTVLLKSGTHLITGVGEALDPPFVDDQGAEWNVRYTPEVGDWDVPGAYRTQVKALLAPGKVQYLPNTGGDLFTIEASNDVPAVTP